MTRACQIIRAFLRICRYCRKTPDGGLEGRRVGRRLRGRDRRNDARQVRPRVDPAPVEEERLLHHHRRRPARARAALVPMPELVTHLVVDHVRPVDRQRHLGRDEVRHRQPPPIQVDDHLAGRPAGRVRPTADPDVHPTVGAHPTRRAGGGQVDGEVARRGPRHLLQPQPAAVDPTARPGERRLAPPARTRRRPRRCPTPQRPGNAAAHPPDPAPGRSGRRSRTRPCRRSEPRRAARSTGGGLDGNRGGGRRADRRRQRRGHQRRQRADLLGGQPVGSRDAHPAPRRSLSPPRRRPPPPPPVGRTARSVARRRRGDGGLSWASTVSLPDQTAWRCPPFRRAGRPPPGQPAGAPPTAPHGRRRRASSAGCPG